MYHLDVTADKTKNKKKKVRQVVISMCEVDYEIVYIIVHETRSSL